MALPVVFMFSGQSSQYHQMGRELYERHPRFRLWMDHCDEIATPLIGRSLCDVVYRDGDKTRPFERLLHTNPALVSFEYSLARVLMEAGAAPAYLLGYSIGEVSATIVGGALGLEDGLRFAIDYARLLESESPPANMLAIVDAPSIEARYADWLGECRVTARNFDRHVVVTGPVPAVQRLREVLARDGVLHQQLAVGFGFHTAMLEPLESRVVALAQRLDFAPLRIPTISCLDGSVFDGTTDAGHWPRHLWAMSRHPVAFEQTIRGLLARGDFHFVDVGPSGTLSTFIKCLLPAGSGSLFGDVVNPFGKDLRTYGNALRRMNLSDPHAGS